MRLEYDHTWWVDMNFLGHGHVLFEGTMLASASDHVKLWETSRSNWVPTEHRYKAL